MKTSITSLIILSIMLTTSCNQSATDAETTAKKDTFEFKADRFADIQVDLMSSLLSRNNLLTISRKQVCAAEIFSSTRNTNTIS